MSQLSSPIYMYYLRNPFKIFIYNIAKYIVVLNCQMFIKKKKYTISLPRQFFVLILKNIYILVLFIICISFSLNVIFL